MTGRNGWLRRREGGAADVEQLAQEARHVCYVAFQHRLGDLQQRWWQPRLHVRVSARVGELAACQRWRPHAREAADKVARITQHERHAVLIEHVRKVGDATLDIGTKATQHVHDGERW
jgi:hypothetical protein